MKKVLTASLAAALLIGSALAPAYAEGHGGGFHGGRGFRGGGFHDFHGGFRGPRFGGGLALGLGLGVLGGALLYPYYAPPVYYAQPYYPPQAYYPPCPPAPPGYYCASDGRLYPYP